MEAPTLRTVALITSVTGLVAFALMIGLITDSVGAAVDDFREGRSRVLERGHVLMLGWSASSITIIEQLALAGESEGGAAIVVLAEKPKAEMERQLSSAFAAGSVRLRGSQVVRVVLWGGVSASVCCVYVCMHVCMYAYV